MDAVPRARTLSEREGFMKAWDCPVSVDGYGA
jgi:hypothetical protein